jgi:zinc transporter ZupT
MLQLLGWALLGTLFIFLMTTLGAATVFVMSGEPKPGRQQMTLGFAAGVMTAASVWSLLLPAMEQAAEPVWLSAAAGVLAGGAFLAVLDGFLSRRCGAEEPSADRLLLLAITLHNIPEGMAVGLAFALAARLIGGVGATIVILVATKMVADWFDAREIVLAMSLLQMSWPFGAMIALPIQTWIGQTLGLSAVMASGAVCAVADDAASGAAPAIAKTKIAMRIDMMTPHGSTRAGRRRRPSLLRGSAISSLRLR